MSETPKYRTSWLARFFDYSEGKLSERDENAFERDLQRDPFVAEAAEGLSLISREEAEEDMRILQRRIRGNRSRSRRLTIISAAAAVVTILIISTIFIGINNNSSNSSESVPGLKEFTAEKPRQEEKTEEQAEEDKAPPEEDLQMIAPGEGAQKGAGKGDAEETAIVKAEEKGRTAKIGDIKSISGAAISAEKDDQKTTGKDQEEYVFAFEEQDEAMIEQEVVAAGAPLTEKVEVEDEQALAPVRIEEVEITAEVQVKPRQQMSATSKVQSSREISGRKKEKVSNQAKQETAAKNLMEDDVDEVEMQEEITMLNSSPNPAMGKKAYKEYIERNLTFPDTLQSFIRAVVVLTFTVLPDGSTDNFEVKKSPSQTFSEAAISAIQNGPEWIPARKDGVYNGNTVRLRVVFRRK